MKINKNALAKQNGFIVGISEMVYEKRISIFNYLYIEKEDKMYTLYRMDSRNNKIRVLNEGIEFERAITKADQYCKWFGNNKK